MVSGKFYETSDPLHPRHSRLFLTHAKILWTHATHAKISTHATHKIFFCHNYIATRTSSLEYIRKKTKAVWVLQPIAYGGSWFIQIDSGKGLYNMWTTLLCVKQILMCVSKCIFGLQPMYPLMV